MNHSLLSKFPPISAEQIARLLALLLIAWQPFIGGPRIPSLLLLLLGIWMLYRRRIDLGSRPVKQLALVFILLLIPVLLSIPGSYNLEGSILVAVALPLFFIVGLAILQTLRSETDLRWLQKWVAIVLLAWVVDGYVQFIFGVDLLGHPLSPDGRVVGIFEDRLRMGFFVTLLMSLMLWDLSKRHPFWAILLMGLIGVIAALSGARTYLLNYLLAIVFLMPAFRWRHRATIVIGFVVVVGASIALSPVIAERMARFTTLDRQSETSLFQKLDHILSGRMNIWNTAIVMTLDRPWTGVGVEAFDKAYKQYLTRPDDPFAIDRPYHAHHMYFSIMAESGLPGLLGIILVVALVTRWFLQAPTENRQLAYPYAASLMVIAFPIQSQPILFRMWWFPVVLLLLCALLAALRVEISPQATTATE